jgi:hypothetical protein
MAVDLEPFNLSDIGVSYSFVSGGRHRILVIAFTGEYRPGSAGNADAHFMHGAAFAGVEASNPSAVIFDFRALKYVWGDMLEMVYNAAPENPNVGQTFSVVVGESSKEAVRSLELGEFSTEPITSIPWLHESLGAAYDFLVRALDEHGT